MKMADVRTKAKEMDVKSGRMKKVDLIHEIQTTEGNFPCFGTAADFCDRDDCCWKEDCLPNRAH